MSKRIIVADTFRDTYHQLCTSLPQGVMLCGLTGMNLRDIAVAIATTHTSTNYTLIEPELSKAGVASISVEQIRSLYEHTRSRTGTQILIIHGIHTASHAAQNAFLKLLEEPREHLHFILTTTDETNVLSTITSRVQTYRIPPLSRQQSEELLIENGVTDSAVRQKLLFLASGLAEQLIELATWPKKQQEALAIAQDAKTILISNSYTTLITLLKYQSDRQKAILLLRTIITMLRTSADQNHTERLYRYVAAIDRLHANQSVRLVLADTVV